MPHGLYPAFTPGGIVPARYAHRFSVAQDELRKRVGGTDALLLALWDQAISEHGDIYKAWYTFTFFMDQKIKELDANSNQKLF